MIGKLARSTVLFTMLAMTGCATVPERDALMEDARAAVYAARGNPQVQSYAPIELDQAVVALRQADDVAARGGRIDEVHDLALLANRRANYAQEVARVRSDEAALAVQRTARDAQLRADTSRRQAESAQLEAAAAQRQAEEAQRLAADIQLRAQGTVPAPVVVLPPPADLAIIQTTRGPVVTLNDTMFDPGSAQLQPSGHYTVQRLAAYLMQRPECTAAIESYTETPVDTYADRRLAERRALAIQDSLAKLGVDPRRTIVRNYGGAYPIASNDTDYGRRMNRRVEIVVSNPNAIVPPRG